MNIEKKFILYHFEQLEFTICPSDLRFVLPAKIGQGKHHKVSISFEYKQYLYLANIWKAYDWI